LGKVLIIKTGITYDSVIKKYGDYDYQIAREIGIPYEGLLVVPVYENIEPVLTEEVSSIIITGSDAMVTDLKPWSVATANWLRQIVHKGIPILGICYGHQLLAQALNGVVDYHPRGKEYGEVEISLTSDGEKDPLFSVLPSNFTGYVAHSQSVIKLPPNARVLAKNDFEASHGVYFCKNVWGVQFHPEFNGDIARMHVEEEKEVLAKDGADVEKLRQNIQDNDYGKILMQRFFELSNKLT
jgi:GMP synthase (glutamine-hydrolysing)